MKMNRLLTAVFALVFIAFSSQAVAQNQDYKIYELFYDDLKQTESLANNTSGGENVAIGKQSLYTASTVGANTAVGYQALSTEDADGWLPD